VRSTEAPPSRQIISGPPPESRLWRRTPALSLRLAAALLALAPLGIGPCRAESSAQECLRLETGLGAITIALDADAAPDAVAEIRRLARASAAGAPGAFDGGAFEFARPHVEIRLSSRRIGDDETVASEIDAGALGLDRDRIADAGEAMNVLQFELLPAAQRAVPAGEGTGHLQRWRERFEKDYDPSFLVGTSRQQILEALGYRFRSGLASKPPLRGAVALVPESPTRSKMELSIFLADLPDRLGKWMVVGRVVADLDVAESISIRPMADLRLSDTSPRDPVVVDHAELTSRCPSPTSGERQ